MPVRQHANSLMRYGAATAALVLSTACSTSTPRPAPTAQSLYNNTDQAVRLKISQMGPLQVSEHATLDRFSKGDTQCTTEAVISNTMQNGKLYIAVEGTKDCTTQLKKPIEVFHIKNLMDMYKRSPEAGGSLLTMGTGNNTVTAEYGTTVSAETPYTSCTYNLTPADQAETRGTFKTLCRFSHTPARILR